jgi:hypothetical protein
MQQRTCRTVARVFVFHLNRKTSAIARVCDPDPPLFIFLGRRAKKKSENAIEGCTSKLRAGTWHDGKSSVDLILPAHGVTLEAMSCHEAVQGGGGKERKRKKGQDRDAFTEMTIVGKKGFKAGRCLLACLDSGIVISSQNKCSGHSFRAAGTRTRDGMGIGEEQLEEEEKERVCQGRTRRQDASEARWWWWQ